MASLRSHRVDVMTAVKRQKRSRRINNTCGLLLQGLLWCLLLVLAQSCDKIPDVLYSDFKGADRDGWCRMQSMDYMPFAEDSAFMAGVSGKKCDIIVTLRHNDYLDKREIWLALEQSDAEGKVSDDTVRIEMCDMRGRWNGRGHRGLYEKDYVVSRDCILPEGYALSVTHAMQADTLKGIVDVGLSIICSDKNE